MSKLGIIDSNQKIVTNGLIFHLDAAQLRSYPSTGSVWRDVSGNNLSGSIGSQTWSNSYGGRINFSGNQTFGIPNDTPIDNISTGVTVNIIVDAPLSSTMAFNVVISRTTNNNWNDGFAFYYGGSNINWWVNNWNDRITYTIPGNGNQTTPMIYTGTYSTTDNLKLYVNGTLHTSRSLSGNISMPANSDLTIGSGPQDSYVWSNNSGLYLAIIYNRPLSATEVLQNFNALKLRFGL